MRTPRPWTVLLLLLVTAPVAGAQLRDRVIRRALAGLSDPERAPESVAFELAGFGPGVAPALLEAVDGGLVETDGTSRPPTLLERRILLQALGRLGRDVVRPLVERERIGEQGFSKTTRLAALGEVGEASDLDRAVAIATPATPREALEPGVADELRTTCERILRRDPAGCGRLRSLVQGSRAELTRSMLEGATATGTREALGLLAGLLGLFPELDPFLLENVAAVGRRVHRPIDPDVLEDVRHYLWESDATLRRDAVFAVGALRDEDAIGRLVRLCREEPSATPVFCEALGEITGLRFGDQVERWRTWYEKEKAWQRDDAPRLFADLRNSDVAAVGRALNELAQRRIFRREISDAVEPLIDRPEPAIRRRACMTLARTGSRAQVPRLVELLDDEDDSVVRAAHAALVSLTDRDLPPTREDWVRGLLEASGP